MVSKQYLYDTLSVTVPQVFVIMVIFDAVITIMMTDKNWKQKTKARKSKTQNNC